MSRNVPTPSRKQRAKREELETNVHGECERETFDESDIMVIEVGVEG
jgi:hypothetical protein